MHSMFQPSGSGQKLANFIRGIDCGTFCVSPGTTSIQNSAILRLTWSEIETESKVCDLDPAF